MTTQAQEDILKEMERILQMQGNEACEAFVLEHYAELPEEAQSAALFAFYRETLEREAADAHIAKTQRQGIEAMNDLEAMKREASDTAA